MMPESTQHKLDRVRRPRVQITYDVETLGSIVKTELPFVVGIMADLSGNAIPTIRKPSQPATENPTPLKDRKFVEIDRDNFNTIMEKIEPKVTIGANELTFTKLEDFDPINVLRMTSLSEKFDSRTRLSNLVAKLDGNVTLQQQFVAEFNNLKNDVTTTGVLDKYYDALYPNLNQTAWTPTVTNATARQGTPNASGLVISRNEADQGEVTHFKITDITGGTLATSDGTAINDADPFIAVSEVKDGLKFTPDNDKGGSFKVFASVGRGVKLSQDFATATIFPFGTPSVEVKPGKKNEPFTVNVKPGEPDVARVTHFKITEIKGGTLTKSDGTPVTPAAPAGTTTPAVPAAFIAAGDGMALKFTPVDAAKGGSFKVQSSTSGDDTGVGSEPATATIVPVKPAAGGGN
jgi:type VI secretion system protein ImpB